MDAMPEPQLKESASFLGGSPPPPVVGSIPPEIIPPQKRFNPTSSSVVLRGFRARQDRGIPVISGMQHPVVYEINESVEVFDILTYKRIRDEVLSEFSKKHPEMLKGPGQEEPLVDPVVKQKIIDLEMEKKTLLSLLSKVDTEVSRLKASLLR